MAYTKREKMAYTKIVSISPSFYFKPDQVVDDVLNQLDPGEGVIITYRGYPHDDYEVTYIMGKNKRKRRIKYIWDWLRKRLNIN